MEHTGHSFQDMSIDYFECNPFNTIGQDWFAIAVEKDGKVNAMTAGWGGMGVMWGKNVFFIVIRKSRYTHELLESCDRLSVNFFPDKKGRMFLKYIGSVSGRDEDKIKNSRTHIDYDDGVPFIDEAKIVFICKKLSVSPINAEHFIDTQIDPKWYADGDYHDLYIVEAEKFMAR